MNCICSAFHNSATNIELSAEPRRFEQAKEAFTLLCVNKSFSKNRSGILSLTTYTFDKCYLWKVHNVSQSEKLWKKSKRSLTENRKIRPWRECCLVQSEAVPRFHNYVSHSISCPGFRKNVDLYMQIIPHLLPEIGVMISTNSQFWPWFLHIQVEFHVSISPIWWPWLIISSFSFRTDINAQIALHCHNHTCHHFPNY